MKGMGRTTGSCGTQNSGLPADLLRQNLRTLSSFFPAFVFRAIEEQRQQRSIGVQPNKGRDTPVVTPPVLGDGSVLTLPLKAQMDREEGMGQSRADVDI